MVMREIGDQEWPVFAREFGHRLGRARLAKGFTQAKLAAVAGLSEGACQRLENGESKHREPANPSLHTLAALCQALEIDLDDLVPHWWPDVTKGRAEA